MEEKNGAALLLVVGEPLTAPQRELILEGITKALHTWDAAATGFDLDSALRDLATQAPEGTDAPGGEKRISTVSESFFANVLINPRHSSVLANVRDLLSQRSHPHRFLVYVGSTVQGGWLLQDDIFAFSSLIACVREANGVLQQERGSLTLSVPADPEWKESLLLKVAPTTVQTHMCPPEQTGDFNGTIQFSAYLSYFIKEPMPLVDLLPASEFIGSIRFSRPTLYVFPAGQGDSALFGVSGFSLLVNGGFGRRACFWDFTRHLDRIDATVVTHLAADNVLGMSAVLERKAQDNIHPEIGCVFMNTPEKTRPAEDKPASLPLNLSEQGNTLVNHCRSQAMVPSPCVSVVSANTVQPINLYHKVGHGTLDMYVLNPLRDSRELKDFITLWSKNAANFPSTKSVPVANSVSVCAVIVWKPTSINEKPTRLLFPGNCPQQKIFEGLDKLKSLALFQFADLSEQGMKDQKRRSVAPVKSAAKVPPTKPAPIKTVPPADQKPPTAPMSVPKPESKRQAPMPQEKKAKPPTTIKTEKIHSKEPTPKKPASPTKAPKAGVADKSANHVSKKASTPTEKIPSTKNSPIVDASPIEHEAALFQKRPHAEDATPSPIDSDKQRSFSQASTQEASPITSQAFGFESQSPATTVPDLLPSQVKMEDAGIYEDEKDMDTEKHSIKSSSHDEQGVDLLGDFKSEDNNPLIPEIQSDHEEHNLQSAPVHEEDNLMKMSNDDPFAVQGKSTALGDFDNLTSHNGAGRDVDEDNYEHDLVHNTESGQHSEMKQSNVNELEDLGIYEEEPESEQRNSDEEGLSRAEADQYLEEPQGLPSPDEPHHAIVADSLEDMRQKSEERDNIDWATREFSGGDTESTDHLKPPQHLSSPPRSFQIHSDPTSEGMPSVNPFLDVHSDNTEQDHASTPEDGVSGEKEICRDSLEKDETSFDPLKDWGQPMGAPPPPEAQIPPAEASKDATKEVKKPGSTSPSKLRKPANANATMNNGRPANKPPVNKAKNGASGDGKEKTATTTVAKKRPTTAPSARSNVTTADTTKTESRPTSRAAPPKRPPSSSTAAAPRGPSPAPVKSVGPAFYVDLAYIPCHGDPAHVDGSFFRRVRARYYVLSAALPSLELLDSLLEAKASWGDQSNSPCTIIPTYDDERIQHWLALHADLLTQLAVDLAPSASRCAIQLQDHDSSCAAYRLEF